MVAGECHGPPWRLVRGDGSVIGRGILSSDCRSARTGWSSFSSRPWRFARKARLFDFVPPQRCSIALAWRRAARSIAASSALSPRRAPKTGHEWAVENRP